MSDLTISAVRAIPLTAQMQAGTRTSQGAFGAVSIVLVEVRTADGILGYGECLGRFGARAYAELINEVFAPRLLGQIGRSELTAARMQLGAFEQAIEAFRVDMGRFPSDAEGLRVLVERPADSPRWRGPYSSPRAVS